MLYRTFLWGANALWDNSFGFQDVARPRGGFVVKFIEQLEYNLRETQSLDILLLR